MRGPDPPARLRCRRRAYRPCLMRTVPDDAAANQARDRRRRPRSGTGNDPLHRRGRRASAAPYPSLRTRGMAQAGPSGETTDSGPKTGKDRTGGSKAVRGKPDARRSHGPARVPRAPGTECHCPLGDNGLLYVWRTRPCCLECKTSTTTPRLDISQQQTSIERSIERLPCRRYGTPESRSFPDRPDW